MIWLEIELKTQFCSQKHFGDFLLNLTLFWGKNIFQKILKTFTVKSSKEFSKKTYHILLILSKQKRTDLGSTSCFCHNSLLNLAIKIPLRIFCKSNFSKNENFLPKKGLFHLGVLHEMIGTVQTFNLEQI